MKCPICGARVYPGADRCSDCGCHVRAHSVPAEEFRPRRERKPLGRKLLVFLGMLPAICIIVFTTLISVSNLVVPEPALPDRPSEIIVTAPADQTPASLPEADEGCFSITDGAVTFLPDRWDGSSIVRIPEAVDGRTVTALAPGCFAGCTELTTIVLPDTLVEIGTEAFFGCTRLRGLFLPDGTAVIGSSAFAGCISLESIYVSASVTSIADGAFADCASLVYIFYEGMFDDWNQLYSGYVTPFTAAICLDGTYYHGTGR